MDCVLHRLLALQCRRLDGFVLLLEDGEALALPTDRVRIPTERELFLYGKVEGAPKGAAGEVARQDFSGSYGYVME